jgi:hypothetical protein
LCVWLRASRGMSAAAIATALGGSVGTVHNLHSQDLRQGDSVLAVCERGGRQRELLTAAAEGKRLAPLASPSPSRARLPQAAPGGPRWSSHWRKLAPRPLHPDAWLGAQQAFKKSSGVWSAPSLRAQPNAVSVCG